MQQELSSTFARLCHLVDETTSEMKDDIKRIDAELAAMEENAARSKVRTWGLYLFIFPKFEASIYRAGPKSGH